MNLVMPRLVYTPLSTLGRILINHESYCYTLEDTVRPKGIKIPGQTAIPAGRYRVIVTESQRFGKMLPLLIDVPNFSGVRLHGGNTAEDTEGCLLVAFHLIDPSKVYESAADNLTKLLLSAREDHYIEIIDTFPYIGSNL
jgi:hypothetical protein